MDSKRLSRDTTAMHALHALAERHKTSALLGVLVLCAVFGAVLSTASSVPVAVEGPASTGAPAAVEAPPVIERPLRQGAPQHVDDGPLSGTGWVPMPPGRLTIRVAPRGRGASPLVVQQIEAMLERGQAAFLHCYAHRGEPNLAGDVRVRFAVLRTGFIGRVRVEPDPALEYLTVCVRIGVSRRIMSSERAELEAVLSFAPEGGGR